MKEEAAARTMTMEMDISAIIEQMETGEQDSALTALQSYNKEVNISTAAWERDVLCALKHEVYYEQLFSASVACFTATGGIASVRASNQL